MYGFFVPYHPGWLEVYCCRGFGVTMGFAFAIGWTAIGWGLFGVAIDYSYVSTGLKVYGCSAGGEIGCRGAAAAVHNDDICDSPSGLHNLGNNISSGC